jgi:hypothetical protein
VTLTAKAVAAIHQRLGMRWREVDTFVARWLLFSPMMIRVGPRRDEPRDGGLTCAADESWERIPFRLLATASIAQPIRPRRGHFGVRMAGRLFDEDYIGVTETAYPGCEWRVSPEENRGHRVADVIAYAFADGVPVGVVAAMVKGL